jgi:hypothetical protein
MTRDLSSNVGTPVELGSDIVYEAGGRRFTGLAAVNAMPSDEYRKRLRDPEFTATVEKLEAAAAKKRK